MRIQRFGHIVAVVILMATFGAIQPASSAELTVIGWNVDSGDADPDYLSEKIAAIRGCDIWGFCEVKDESWAKKFVRAAQVGENAAFSYVFGSTSIDDKLLIVYNSDRFAKVRDFEIHEVNTV